MTPTQDGIVHRSCTRIQLINALRDIEPGGMTKLRSLGSLADLIMARLPGTSPVSRRALAEEITAAFREGERERVAQLADNLGATVPVQGGTMPFSTVIRHQQPEPKP